MSVSRFTRFLVLGSLAASFAPMVAADAPCGPGTYIVTSSPTQVCDWCPPGTYNNQPPSNTCTSAQVGWKACGDQTVNGNPCYGATKQDQCGAGYYQPFPAMSSCLNCPRGHQCQGPTDNTAQACSPGWYAANENMALCERCPVGTYNNVNGAHACCNCCAGTFQDQTGQTHCQDCWEHTNPHRSYSMPGATSSDQCSANPIPGYTNNNVCKDTIPMSNAPGTAICLPEQGDGIPNPSAINKRHATHKCAPGYKSCPRLFGQGGFDCVDTRNDPESCGGCVDPTDDNAAGKDCTAIPDVNVTRCVKSACVIDSCRKGFTKSEDGSRCIELDIALTNQSARRNASHHKKWQHRGISRADSL